MGRYHKEIEINWTPLTIYTGSFMRFLMKDFGFFLNEGIIIVTDNEILAGNFISDYCMKTLNGCKVTSWKKRKKYPENYCCMFLVVSKTTTEAEVIEFLQEQDFLPIIICGGVLPEYLRRQKHIFRLHKSELEIGFYDKRKNFQQYLIQNVPEICEILKNLESSIACMEYSGNTEMKNSFKFFAAIGCIYAKYLRKKHSERDVSIFLQKYSQETYERFEEIPKFASGDDIPDLISELIWDFPWEEKGVKIVNLNSIDKKVDESLKAKCAVLYDHQFYYFPPELFMKICAPIIGTMSETELKKRLKSEGIIKCDSADYTSKKTIYYVHKQKERLRFLWVYKDKILSSDNLQLEDVFAEDNEGGNEECTEIL